MTSTFGRVFKFYVNRLSIVYAGTGAVNALMIDGWLYLLTHDAHLALPISTLIAVVTSIFTDYTWKCEVVFRSPLDSVHHCGSGRLPVCLYHLEAEDMEPVRLARLSIQRCER